MWLFALFVAIPLIEIALFIQVGGFLGLWPTLGIVLLTAFVGTAMVRAQGALAMRQLRGSINALRDPTEPLAHGAMVLVAGVLLLTPGFATDALGLALLIPAVRRRVFEAVRRRVELRRFDYGAPGAAGPSAAQPGGPRAGQRPGAGRPSPAGEIIEGEYSETEPVKTPTHSPSGWTRH
ncbi:FxsA family protein [Profundibacterium mesophilum]|uniref:FxsA cytoplasmic membrane protein n=1 Tax=Profundibacterium mesophilum KAUST100406-0324 TaxID=1037889 RepID=A0A921NPS1_9RHOB|nr:FxsA family protein [Profundibacterium mesophilum]KAF0676311.1 putative FxsA cytoplasmic membrane protein [Profundibacterium mesophilum KAUST100406-0324]